MQITEVRIKLMEEAGERLQAFCSITFDDCFVIRDLKIIEGTSGPFVAMPSRKLTAHCPQCGSKNHLRAGYCNQCGGRLKDDRAVKDEEGRSKLYADIAHPINSACREMIQERVIKSFHEEIEKSRQPGYVSSYDDFDEDLVAGSHRETHAPRRSHERREPAIAAAPAEAPKVHHPLEGEPRTGHKVPAPHSLPVPHSVPAAQNTAKHTDAGKRPNFGAGIL